MKYRVWVHMEWRYLYTDADINFEYVKGEVGI